MKLTRNDIVDIFVKKSERLNSIDTVVMLSLCFLNLLYVLYRKNVIDIDDVEYILKDGE